MEINILSIKTKLQDLYEYDSSGSNIFKLVVVDLFYNLKQNVSKLDTFCGVVKII